MPQTFGMTCRGLAAAILAVTLSACAAPSANIGTPPDEARSAPPPETVVRGESAAPVQTARRRPAGRPVIVGPRSRLQCVPYARELSNIQIRGDAWTWWKAAERKYRRGQRPAVGAVLVLKRKGRSRGHLAVVTEVVGDREVIANHANWLNRGQVHLNTPIRDVSANNDWSAVKIWYTPGNVLGRSAYPAYGFIYPQVVTAEN